MEPGYKICPSCANPCHTGALECPDCGHAFRIGFVSPSAPLRPTVSSPAEKREYFWPVLCAILCGALLAMMVLQHREQPMPAPAPVASVPEQQTEQPPAPPRFNQNDLRYTDSGVNIPSEVEQAQMQARENAMNAAAQRIMAQRQMATPPVSWLPPPSTPSFQSSQQSPQMIWHSNPSTAVVMPPGSLPYGAGGLGLPSSSRNYNPGGRTLYR